MKQLFFLLAVVFSQVVSAQADEVGIFINPATIDFNLTQGQTSNQKLMIINKTKEKKQFRLYLSDWIRDTVGKHAYTAPGTVTHSCSRWVTLEKNFVELGPGETAQLNVRLQLPDSIDVATSMRWAMVFVETIEETKSPSVTGKEIIAAGITTQYRVGVHIYQTPPNVTNRDLRMLSFDVKPNSADSVYRIVCENTGATQIRCKSFLELANMADGKKTTIERDEFPLFPEQKRYVDFTIPKTLPKGKYTVIGAVDGGADLPLEAAQKIIEIK